MTIEVNWVVLAIVVAIIVFMAIVGYAVEGTDLGGKRKEKKKDKKEETVSEVEETLEEAPSAWTGEIEQEDPTHEEIHTVPTIEDWTQMPTDDVDALEAPNLEEELTTENEENTFEEPQMVDVSVPVTEENTDSLFTEMDPNSTEPNIEPMEINLENNETAEENLDTTQELPITNNEESTENLEELQPTEPAEEQQVDDIWK